MAPAKFKHLRASNLQIIISIQDRTQFSDFFEGDRSSAMVSFCVQIVGFVVVCVILLYVSSRLVVRVYRFCSHGCQWKSQDIDQFADAVTTNGLPREMEPLSVWSLLVPIGVEMGLTSAPHKRWTPDWLLIRHSICSRCSQSVKEMYYSVSSRRTLLPLVSGDAIPTTEGDGTFRFASSSLCFIALHTFDAGGVIG